VPGPESRRRRNVWRHGWADARDDAGKPVRAQKQQLNQDGSRRGSVSGRAGRQRGTSAENTDQTATSDQPYALPGANADEQYQYASI
jgi:hypothetical protein